MDEKQKAERLILVTGATGNQGGTVARHLLQEGFRVRVIVRNPDKPAARTLLEQGAEVVQGDLDEPASLERALGDVYGVFGVLRFFETDQEREVAQGISLANAAKTAGVQHFVYSSAASAHRNTGVPHIESKWKIEQYIRQIDLPYTVLRPVAFNYSLNPYRNSVLSGILAEPFKPETKIFQIAEEDFAHFVSIAFANPDRWLEHSLDVAGDMITAQEMANVFGRVIGNPVKYVQISWDEARKVSGDEVTRLMEWIENEGPDINVFALRKEYKWLMSLEQYLRKHGWENAQLSS